MRTEAHVSRTESESAEVLPQPYRSKEHCDFVADMRSEPDAAGQCYFIGCAEGMVKIGHSRNLPRRFNEIKSASLFKLKVLAAINGGRTAERYYHRLFEQYALGDEWFERSPEIDREIAWLNGGVS